MIKTQNLTLKPVKKPGNEMQKEMQKENNCLNEAKQTVK